MKKEFLTLLICFLSVLSFSQNEESEKEFRSPLGIPLVLSGTFAELRSNHFHGGLDIKTNGKQGYKVYTTKEGFVSRIKVQAYGYGHALYIQHPNGYTTVYGHLKRFNDEIAAYVKQQQYNQQSFEVDLYPSSGQFQLDKGDVIAFSGNSGSSGGPHLHYEIRRTNGQIPINPLEFTDVRDNIKPTIFGIRVHELNGSFYDSKAQTFDANYLSAGNYDIGSSVIVNQPVVGVSISAIDKLDGANNKNGFVSLKCFVDGNLNFEYSKDEIPFDKSRYINAHVDYPEKKREGGTYVNTFTLDGNQLNIYNPSAKDGRIWLSQYPKRDISIVICDHAGNESKVNFSIEYQPSEQLNTIQNVGKAMMAEQYNVFSENGIRVEIPQGALYDDIHMTYEQNQTTIANHPTYSNLHQVHNETVPLHKLMTVEVQQTSLPSELRSKAVLANLDRSGRIDVNTGTWIGDYLQVKTRNFGQYFITTDTTKPKIRQYQAPASNDYTARTHMQFKISDDLSGIKSYRATVDGQWVLMEYDPKRNLLYHVFDERISKGNHKYKLEVTDAVYNVGVMEFDFTR